MERAIWKVLIASAILCFQSGCDSTAKSERELITKLKFFHLASHCYVDNNPTFPSRNENPWLRDYIPKFKKVNYRCAIMACDAPLGSRKGEMSIEEQASQVVESGRQYFESGSLRLYANFEGVGSVPTPYYDGPVFLYAAFLQSELGTTWWDDRTDHLPFEEIAERHLRSCQEQRVFVLLNDGRIGTFLPVDWAFVKPLLDPNCRENERNRALEFLRIVYASIESSKSEDSQSKKD